MPRIPRALVALGTVLALAALAAGCGGEDDTTAQAPASPTATEAVQSAVVAGPRLTSGPVDKEAFVADLLTAIDAYTSVHLSIRAASMGSGEADVSYGPGGTRVRVDAALANQGTSQFVIADGKVYIEQQQRGTFLRIDQTDPTYGDLLRRVTDIGPRESIAGLGKGILSVVRIAPRTVDGVELNGYRVKADPNKSAGAFRVLAGTSGVSGVLTFNLFTDDENLLRLIEVAGTESSTASLTDWGKPVSIEVPTEDQLVNY